MVVMGKHSLLAQFPWKVTRYIKILTAPYLLHTSANTPRGKSHHQEKYPECIFFVNFNSNLETERFGFTDRIKKNIFLHLKGKRSLE